VQLNVPIQQKVTEETELETSQPEWFTAKYANHGKAA